MEPPFWWSGTRLDQIEVMLYAPGIGQPGTAVDVTGTRLDGVTRTDNPNYLFLTLKVPRGPGASSARITVTAPDGAVRLLSYEFRARAPHDSYNRGFDTSDAIYLITPDRFANGDPSNDAVPDMLEGQNRADKDGRHGGDLAGISQHLDYIADMGFTMVWINPLLENRQTRTSYHGYATTDFYRIDPRYGSNQDYRTLVRNARDKGLGVIMDVVPNHIGDGHWWMQDPPSDDWINNGGQYQPTSHMRPAWFDPYASDFDKARFADGWFATAMPDLNQRNPQVARYLIQNTLWWIEFAGLSGLRVDTIGYPDRAFTRRWLAAILREYPTLGIVGEEWSDNPLILAPWQREVGYPSLMDFPTQARLVQGLATPEGWRSGITTLYESLYNDRAYVSPSSLVVFADNHDMDRIMTQMGDDPALVRMALAYVAVIPRIPQLYYGTEILMTNTGHPDDHGRIRADMPGGWPTDQVNAFTGESLTDEARAMQQFVRALFRWRRSANVVHTGETMHFAPIDGEGLYVVTRYSGNGALALLVINKSDQDRVLDLNRYKERLHRGRRGRNVLTGAPIRLTDGFKVRAGSVLVADFSP